ncbi:MAG: hypothetical protein A2X77_00305 [Gammaproteobacteria bacterium GWE2_42_36]|nr:MAG: hypothetical protein A2X77_00305 [Gammaproteobacteria bacterium GWE2_42_36]HCU05257.1 hypothetical protein [Coxiellaceae bacterium]
MAIRSILHHFTIKIYSVYCQKSHNNNFQSIAHVRIHCEIQIILSVISLQNKNPSITLSRF